MNLFANNIDYNTFIVKLYVDNTDYNTYIFKIYTKNTNVVELFTYNTNF